MTLVIMRGLPGSGKTFTAKKICGSLEWYEYCYCSTDDFFVNESGEYIFDSSKLGKYHRDNIRNADYAMYVGVPTVVVDNTNVTRKDMKPYVDIANQYGYEIEYRESESLWWADIRRHSKQWRAASDNELFVPAARLAWHCVHKVPVDVIVKMMRKWIDVDS